MIRSFLAGLSLAFTASIALAQVPLAPNPALTPGVVDPAATKERICVGGYTSQPGIRHVTAAIKRRVFAEYGVDPKSDKFEVDHLISLELGGSNDLRNLWPQSYTTMPYNAHVKDALENRLHALVCSGRLDLATAQKAISVAWVTAYLTYVKPAP